MEIIVLAGILKSKPKGLHIAYIKILQMFLLTPILTWICLSG
jgi:hypothetical protein